MTPSSEHGGKPESRPPRLSQLLGLPVSFADGRAAGYVNDARLSPTGRVRGLRTELVIEGLVVGRRPRGTLLGYDRKREQGPWLVRTIVRRIYRHGGFVPWEAVAEVDLERRGVTLNVDTLKPLEAP